MIIGIDAKPISLNYPCGIKTYATNLLFNLAKTDKKNRYYIFSPNTIPIPNQLNFKLIANHWPIPWQLKLPILSLANKTDVFHILQQHGSVLINHPKIITTVHDMASQNTYPNWNINFYYYILGYYTRLVRKFIIQKSKFIIAVSNFTKSEIENSGLTKAPINVVYEGVTSYRNIPGSQRAFFLTMADFSPRKNFISTIRAYSLLSEKQKERHKLFIVISNKKFVSPIKKFIQNLNVYSYVELIICPTGKELTRLYKGAKAFIYLSTYEGFGLPILEAYTHYCPLITCRYGAIPEVAKNNALYVNPFNLQQIKHMLEKVIDQPQFCLQLSKRAKKLANELTWLKTARKTQAIYEKIYRL